MAIPSVDVTIKSGLGNTAPSPAGTIAVFGCSSAGTANVVNDPYAVAQNIVTDYGYGPGPDLAANLVASGVPTIFVKVATDTAGTSSAVTHSGTGASVLTLTSSTPFDTTDVIVTVTRSGTAGTAPEPGFKVSFDGGKTTTGEIRMPTNHIYTGFQATHGTTLNFTAASMVAGDTYTFTTTGPTWVVADVEAAIAALLTANPEAGLLYVVGAAAETDAAGINTSVGAFLPADKFIRCLVETRDIDVEGDETEAQWMASISADYATLQTDYLVVNAGAADVVSALSKDVYRRNIGWLAILRAAGVSVGVDLARVKDGYLVPFRGASPVTTVYHDERLTPGLDANRFCTVRSFSGKTGGFFVTNPNIMCGPLSDYKRLQYGRVIDEAARISTAYFVEQLSDGVRLDRKTGHILDRDARQLELGNDQQLANGLFNLGQISNYQTVVERGDDIVNTETLTVTVYIQPLGYLKTIKLTLTFVASLAA